MQSLDFCEETLSLSPLNKKFESFGYNVLSIDGHNHDELRKAFNTTFENENSKMILANTIKGKGISFMENNILWHYRTPQGEEYDAAVKELEKQRP
jgi:transketolase